MILNIIWRGAQIGWDSSWQTPRCMSPYMIIVLNGKAAVDNRMKFRQPHLRYHPESDAVGRGIPDDDVLINQIKPFPYMLRDAWS